MISISYQTMCISVFVILIIGIIIGASMSSSKENPKERERRPIWTEVTEEELEKLGKYKRVDEVKQKPDFIKPKFPRDINIDDLLKDDDFLKGKRGKDK